MPLMCVGGSPGGLGCERDGSPLVPCPARHGVQASNLPTLCCDGETGWAHRGLHGVNLFDGYRGRAFLLFLFSSYDLGQKPRHPFFCLRRRGFLRDVV